MSTKVIMPQMGESIVEGTITKWLKKVGEKVGRDEPLFEISTDKVDSEIPSPAAGVVTEILVPEGQTVQINTVVAVIGDAMTEAAVAPAIAAAPREAEAKPAEPVEEAAPPAAPAPEAPPPAPAPSPAAPPVVPAPEALPPASPAPEAPPPVPAPSAGRAADAEGRRGRSAPGYPYLPAGAQAGAGKQHRSVRDSRDGTRRPNHEGGRSVLPRTTHKEGRSGYRPPCGAAGSGSAGD